MGAPFLAAMLSQDKVKALLSSEHFSVDGTSLESWTSLKRFRPKDGSDEPAAPGRNSLPRRTSGASGTFTASGGATAAIARRPVPRPACFVKGRAKKKRCQMIPVANRDTAQSARSTGLLSSARRSVVQVAPARSSAPAYTQRPPHLMEGLAEFGFSGELTHAVFGQTANASALTGAGAAAVAVGR